MISRLLRRLANWIAPIGFECDRCGFVVGDDIDRGYHRLAHDIADARAKSLEEAAAALDRWLESCREHLLVSEYADIERAVRSDEGERS